MRKQLKKIIYFLNVLQNTIIKKYSAIIAEIKKASPSKGILGKQFQSI